MVKLKLSGAIGLVTFMVATSVFAEIQASEIELGAGVNLTPSINLDIQYDDNLTNAKHNEIESWVTIFNPNFLFSAENDKSAYSLNYSLIRGDHYASDEDNFTDHDVTVDAAWELTARHRWGLHGSYLDGHEARGSSFSRGVGASLNKPDQYQDTDFQIRYGFGVKTAKGHVDIELGSKNRDFEGGVRTETRDRKTDYGGITFRYNLGASTEVLAEINHRDFVYAVTAAGEKELDSDETDFLMGITWDGTAKTTGTVKLGIRRKDFDDNSRDDATKFRWDAGVRWSPRTYSSFDFNASRNSEEATGAGDFIDVKSYSLVWNHSWQKNLSSNLSYDYTQKDYEGVTGRDEEINSASFRLNYQMQRWLELNGGITYTEMDASLTSLEYDRTVFSIGLKASL